MQDGNKVAVVHPTGTGKTYIALKWVEKSEGKTIYVAPTNYILKQVQETIEQARASEQLSEEEYRRYKEVKYITYNSLMELSKLDSGYQNIILDEFHRCGAPEWGKGVNRLLEKSPNAKIIGLSATPLRAVDKKDMADELFEGQIASEMTLEEAVAEGIIQAPIYINGIYALNEVVLQAQAKISRIEDKKAKQEIEKKINEAKRQLEKAEGLEEIFEKYARKTDGKYIVFCSDIKDMHKKMQEAEKWFSKVGKTKLYEISYRKSEQSNEDTLTRFRNEKDETIHLLFSVDKLNEGIHVDGIDGVIMLRKTESPLVYTQQLGRALSAGNKGIPLVFDLVNNIETSRYIYEFIERVQAIRQERGIEDKNVGNIKIIELQREVKEILAIIDQKLARNEKKLVARTLEIAEILHSNGIDCSKLKRTRNVNGKSIFIQLSDIKQDGIDIERIIEENELDRNLPIGTMVKYLIAAYNGTSKILITEEEKRKAEKLGLVQIEKRKTVVAEALEIAQILYNNGVDLSKLQLTTRGRGKKRVYLRMSEIKQKGIEIAKIIEENRLDGSLEIGKLFGILRSAYNGNQRGYAITEEERNRIEQLGILQIEKPRIAKTLEVTEILYNNGVDLSKLKLTYKTGGKVVYTQLSDIKQDGINIAKIIEENGLDGTLEIGRHIINLRTTYKGKTTLAMTEEEKRKAEQLALVQKEKTRVAKTLEMAEILHNNGVDFSKLQLSERTGKKHKVYLKIEEIKQKGINMQKIIEENELEENLEIGKLILNLRLAYNGKGGYSITEEEKRKIEELGLLHSQTMIEKTLEVAEILYNNGIDLEHLQLSKIVNGIREYTRILDIRQDEIDIARIIEENDLDGNLKIGDSIGKLRAIYKGKKNITMTEEEKRKVETLGIIPKQIARRQEKTGGNKAIDADLSEQERQLKTNGVFQDDSGESLKELEDKLQGLVVKKKASSQLVRDFEGLKKQKDAKKGIAKE